ncbi:phosphoserine phosphatase SerB [Litorimonas sp. WD9-15]|uniref:phosphoserine phosphatase SerB n=1 Tax=Litorimonas sp. WD9-15 TaxID=3418716 RepID=UPI003CFDFE7C
MSDSVIDTITTLVLKNSDEDALRLAQEAVGLKVSRVLSKGKAVEGQSELTTSQDGAKRLDAEGIEVDICVMPVEGRRKSLLICDMDSTLIGQECIDELADYAGVKDRVSAITERAMRGEIGFDGALRERVGLLEDLPLSMLQLCFDERIHLNAGARTLCQTMKAAGAKTVIVSGGFTFFSGRVAEACGFEHHQANILLDDGTNLTGQVAKPILGREAKLEAMRSHITDTSNAIAIGDGANDLAMITAAGLGLAYYAKPAVAEAAHSAIRFTDLRTALYYQGFSDAEFIEE